MHISNAIEFEVYDYYKFADYLKFFRSRKELEEVTISGDDFEAKKNVYNLNYPHYDRSQGDFIV